MAPFASTVRRGVHTVYDVVLSRRGDAGVSARTSYGRPTWPLLWVAGMLGGMERARGRRSLSEAHRKLAQEQICPRPGPERAN